eukprot:s40_g19.t1
MCLFPIDVGRHGTATEENLIGKPLFPHVSYRHASLMVNFGKPMAKLPFTCRSVSEAATAHASVTPAPSGKFEMLMPVAFPDEGTFDWLDSFLEANPKYTELSDRKMMEWAVASGLTRPKLGLNASNDKPNYQYGVHSLDDNSLMKVVQSVPSIQPRNFVVMEVKSNLVAEERAQILKRFPGYKKVAHVVMGEPKKAYKLRVHQQILKQKQAKSDSTWRMKKAQQEQKKRILEQQKLMAEKKKEMEEKKKAEAEAKKAEEAKKAKEAKEAKEGEEGEEAAAEEEPAAEETEAKDAEMKEEEPKAEETKAEEPAKAEEEDLGDEPPQVELTEEEEKQNFIKGSIPDVSPAVLAKAFASFTVPEKSEGFDEVNYEWQGAPESKEYLRKWVLETKLTTRIEDLQPSNDFKEKYSAWQKAFTELQTKQKAWKSGGKKDGAKEGGFVDIFSVEDINDIGGGEPLYSHFEAEDWAMLQLRYEFFLLQDFFIKDVNDEDRTAIPEAHLAFYYQKYFKKAINTKQFSLSDVPELLKLIKDTVAIDEETKMFSKVLEDAESLDLLVKYTEESRKERQRRIDAGDETARLKFLSHNPAPAPVPAAVPPAPAAVGLQKGMKGKAMGKGKPMKGMMGNRLTRLASRQTSVQMLRLAVKRDSRIAQRDAKTKRSLPEAKVISTEQNLGAEGMDQHWVHQGIVLVKVRREAALVPAPLDDAWLSRELISGKENGETYDSVTPLDHSPTAIELLDQAYTAECRSCRRPDQERNYARPSRHETCSLQQHQL